ncbi:MAG: quinol:cytochrome C oxidoreductase [Flavobacteriaceae bacterium]|nr:quinol:cytochrome C oxidoreductase [Flavobacteriaceae bacterium]
MYQLPNTLRNFAFALILIGAIGVIYGFLTVPTLEDVKSSHEVTTEVAHQTTDNMSASATDEHSLHVLHQLQNRPWAALYVAIFFFMMIALGVLAFYAIQHAAQAGWSVVLFRVMEAITAYLPFGTLLLFVFLVFSGLDFNHLFVWMNPELLNPESAKYDELIANKSGYLNVPFFLIRAAIYMIGWNAYRYFSRKYTIAQDTATDDKNYFKLFKLSAAFLVFFIVTESMMSWDWIMSLDPHWFSTLFGWYIFSSMIVSSVTTIAIVTIYLKSKGYLENVNNSHIHDLAKYMFGFSVFWAYLWFSQFMLIWYANIPEEVTYFITRMNDYKIPFLGMVVLNLVFPLIVLMNSDYKKVYGIVIVTGIVILIGHYIDIFVMIMPATVGDQWIIGIPEISSVLLLLGCFIYIIFNALTKAPLLAKRSPFVKESENFHYYNID